jgi:Uma2 family endonuclease
MVAAGILDNDTRRELVDGVLYDMSPPGPRHRHVVAMLTEHLVIGVRGRFWVRVQDVILTSDEGWRSPDLLVVPREDEERADRALLVVEVSNTTRGRDDEKAAVYAEIGVAEYWIIDVNRDEVLVHREPRDNAYANIERMVPGDAITPLIDVPPVDVAALLAR